MSFLSARRKSGLSQAAVAKELGVSDAAVCMWETGKTHPRTVLLPKIAKLFGCTIDELMNEGEAEEKLRSGLERLASDVSTE